MTAFIFDVDGTLAETERYGHRVAFNRAFAEAELNWYWSEALYGELLSISGGKERICHFMTHHLPDYTPPDQLDEFVQQLHAAKNRHYRQLLQEGKIPLRPGVKRVITEAYQRGITLAIATTSSLENTMTLLETQFGNDAYFNLIAAGDVVQEKKPAPDIYYYVLERLGVSADHCLVFEDSQSGLEAATQAHLKTVITVNDYTAHQNFSEAVLVLNHLGEPDQPFTVYRGSDLVRQKYFDLTLAHSLFNA